MKSLLQTKNKKGDASDYFIFVILLFFLAVSFVTVAYVNHRFSLAITTTTLNDSSVSAQIVEQYDIMTTETIQNGYIAIFAFLIIGTIASSFLVKIHPIFVFLWIIFGMVGILVSVVLSNAYGMFIQTEILADIATQQPMITWVMQNMVVIMIGTIALSMIILFAKLPSFGGRSEVS